MGIIQASSVHLADEASGTVGGHLGFNRHFCPLGHSCIIFHAVGYVAIFAMRKEILHSAQQIINLNNIPSQKIETITIQQPRCAVASHEATRSFRGRDLL